MVTVNKAITTVDDSIIFDENRRCLKKAYDHMTKVR